MAGSLEVKDTRWLEWKVVGSRDDESQKEWELEKKAMMGYVQG